MVLLPGDPDLADHSEDHLEALNFRELSRVSWVRNSVERLGRETVLLGVLEGNKNISRLLIKYFNI